MVSSRAPSSLLPLLPVPLTWNATGRVQQPSMIPFRFRPHNYSTVITPTQLSHCRYTSITCFYPSFGLVASRSGHDGGLVRHPSLSVSSSRFFPYSSSPLLVLPPVPLTRRKAGRVQQPSTIPFLLCPHNYPTVVTSIHTEPPPLSLRIPTPTQLSHCYYSLITFPFDPSNGPVASSTGPSCILARFNHVLPSLSNLYPT